MKNNRNIEIFKEQSTWRLIFLTLITGGIYSAHYVHRQSKRLNEVAIDHVKISGVFIGFVYLVSYLGLVLLLLNIYYEVIEVKNLNVIAAEKVSDYSWRISMLAFGFKARNRVNSMFGYDSEPTKWFSGLLTFFFSQFYFNYKVNKICNMSYSKLEPE